MMVIVGIFTTSMSTSVMNKYMYKKPLYHAGWAETIDGHF